MTDYYLDNVLRERWDDTARVYTAWDASGTQTLQRPYTAAENTLADARVAQQTQDTNRSSLQSKASTALSNNATFLAIASPTNAQVAAQVKALTRQNNAVIRLILNQLDDTAGT